LNVIGLVQDQIGRIYYPDWTYWSPVQCTQYETGTSQLSQISPANTYDKKTGKATTCGSNYHLIEGYPLSEQQMHVPSAISTDIGYALNAIALIGLIVGQIFFGLMGDRFGRKRMFVLTLLFMAIFSLLTGMTIGEGTEAVITCLCIFRFCLGIFIGGDYPLSGVLISEFSNTKNRGLLVVMVFSCQGVGYMLSEGVVSLFAKIWIVTGSNPDYLWRICLMFGAIPALLSLWSRITMPESPRWRLFNELNAAGMLSDVEKVFERHGVADPDEAAEVMRQLALSREQHIKATHRSVHDYRYFFKKYGWILCGTGVSWMMQDIAFYSKVLFGLSGVIGPQIGMLDKGYMYTGPGFLLQNTAVEFLINLSSIYPGYVVAFLTVDIIGRWRMQQLGFFVMMLVSALLAGLFTTLKTQIGPFWVLYALNGFFNNVGPNATTYLIPAEVFPSEWRTTGAGFSAAMGKFGAVIGTFGFSFMVANPSLSYQGAFGLLAGTAFIGILVTFLIPESTNKSLETLGSDTIDFERVSTSDSGMRKSSKVSPYDGMENRDVGEDV